MNIFDFDQTIYWQDITVCFMARLRDEKKFGSLDELKNQLAEDKKEALKALSNA